MCRFTNAADLGTLSPKGGCEKIMSSNREAVSYRHMAHWRYNDIKELE